MIFKSLQENKIHLKTVFLKGVENTENNPVMRIKLPRINYTVLTIDVLKSQCRLNLSAPAPIHPPGFHTEVKIQAGPQHSNAN